MASRADVALGDGPFEVVGRVEEDGGIFSLVAEQVRAVDGLPNVVDLQLASKRLAASFGHGDEYADVNVGGAA